MNTLKITDIKIRGVSVPLNIPIVSHLGIFDYWPYICLDVYTNSKIVGKSYIGPYLLEQLPSIAHCIKALSNKFLNNNVSPHTIYNEGMKYLSLLGYKGIGLYALAAVDIALWDIISKLHNLPLAKYLGGSIKPIKTYNSSGLWLIKIKELAKEAEKLRIRGNFSALKLRIGRETAKLDEISLKEVKKGAGEDVIILSDFNQCFTAKEGLRRCKELDKQGFFWFEEPIKYNEYNDLAKICFNVETPITIGENFHGIPDLIQAISSKSCDMIMPDLMRIGGISNWLKLAAIAEAYNLEVSSHLFPEVTSHLMMVTPTAEWLEWVDWQNPILVEPYKIKDGFLIIPAKPGIGIDWNEKVLEKYSVNLSL